MGFEWLPAKNYKRHYICLKCKKGFKRPSEADMKHSVSTDFSDLMNEYYANDIQQDIIKYIDAAYRTLKVVCPNCQNSMLQVDYNFKVPPQRDKKSWKILQERFFSSPVIHYKVYVEWHRIALQKVVSNSIEYKKLKQNLEKLERI